MQQLFLVLSPRPLHFSHPHGKHGESDFRLHVPLVLLVQPNVILSSSVIGSSHAELKSWSPIHQRIVDERLEQSHQGFFSVAQSLQRDFTGLSEQPFHPSQTEKCDHILRQSARHPLWDPQQFSLFKTDIIVDVDDLSLARV